MTVSFMICGDVVKIEVRLSKQADKFLARTDRITKERIKLALKKLEHEPPQGDIKPLIGYPELFRLTIGGYRAVFYISNNVIRVTKIDSRGQVYKNL